MSLWPKPTQQYRHVGPHFTTESLDTAEHLDIPLVPKHRDGKRSTGLAIQRQCGGSSVLRDGVLASGVTMNLRVPVDPSTVDFASNRRVMLPNTSHASRLNDPSTIEARYAALLDATAGGGSNTIFRRTAGPFSAQSENLARHRRLVSELPSHQRLSALENLLSGRASTTATAATAGYQGESASTVEADSDEYPGFLPLRSKSHILPKDPSGRPISAKGILAATRPQPLSPVIPRDPPPPPSPIAGIVGRNQTSGQDALLLPELGVELPLPPIPSFFAPQPPLQLVDRKALSMRYTQRAPGESSTMDEPTQRLLQRSMRAAASIQRRLLPAGIDKQYSTTVRASSAAEEAQRQYITGASAASRAMSSGTVMALKPPTVAASSAAALGATSSSGGYAAALGLSTMPSLQHQSSLFLPFSTVREMLGGGEPLATRGVPPPPTSFHYSSPLKASSIMNNDLSLTSAASQSVRARRLSITAVGHSVYEQQAQQQALEEQEQNSALKKTRQHVPEERTSAYGRVALHSKVSPRTDTGNAASTFKDIDAFEDAVVSKLTRDALLSTKHIHASVP